MNSIQLAILLDKYSDLLWSAFDEISEALPEDLRTTETNILGQTEFVYPILKPLTDVINNLDEDVNELKERTEE